MWMLSIANTAGQNSEFGSSLRNTLGLAAIALVKEMTHLPVIVDPSHATGKRSLIAACSRAALAVGADGLIVEVHPDPDNACSDGAQSLTFDGSVEVIAGLSRPVKETARTVLFDRLSG
jgi:3-deoxy-7-phosphoheptulonate synthase